MFHIGIATKHPPLPEKGELSDLGIDFVETCLNIDPMKRPSAGELMEHPWIQQFSQEIAREMHYNEQNVGQVDEQEELAYDPQQQYEEGEISAEGNAYVPSDQETAVEAGVPQEDHAEGQADNEAALQQLNQQ